jgi:hypothetical protein
VGQTIRHLSQHNSVDVLRGYVHDAVIDWTSKAAIHLVFKVLSPDMLDLRSRARRRQW